MLSNLPLFIGLRYTRSKRSEGFVSFISGFSLCAMALGVTALIVVLSVMNGFDREIKSRLLKVVPHITLTSSQGFNPAQIADLQSQLIGADQAVVSAVPILQSFVMISHNEQQTGVVLQGVDPELPSAEKLAENMLSGYVEELAEGEFGIILGSQLARKLDVFVGDRLQLTLPKVSVSPAGIFPRIKGVTVVGIFQVGAQVDASVAFIHHRDGQKLLQMGDRYQGVQLELADPFLADSWLLQNQANFQTKNMPADSLQWRTWMDDMGSLFQAMRMEKVIVSLLLSVIIAVAAFNIVASLVLMVSDKRKDIAVVRTLGASSSTVIQIFIIQGLAVGALGIVSGTILGCLLAYFIGDIVAAIESLSGFYMFDPSVYLISALPSRILIGDVLIVVGGAFIISFLATLYPAWRAGKVLPAEALRYDH
jgi:lipoprotein-releasing system permease protein